MKCEILAYATKINKGVRVVCSENCDFCPIVGDDRFFSKDKPNKQKVKDVHAGAGDGNYSPNFLKTIENGGRTN